MSRSSVVERRAIHVTQRPRGVTVLLVLALLTMTLALSYAMIRNHFTMEQAQGNYQRLSGARQVAQTGLSIALRKMTQTGWTGVGTSFTAALGSGLSFTASYVAGDDSLVVGDTEYGELPYRVTVLVTGTASDPISATSQSSHTLRAVVRFIPRKLADVPANWNTTQAYTVYQWGTTTDDVVRINLPAHIEGPLFAQNQVSVGDSYPGIDDNRPFTGQIDEVAIFGKALSASQILGLYDGTQTLANLTANSSLSPVAWWKLDEPANATVALDQFGDYNGVIDGAKLGATAAPVNGGSGSANFDGYNDHIHLGPVDEKGNELTITCWVKPSGFNQDLGRIIAKSTGVNIYDQVWMLRAELSSGNQRVRFRLLTSNGVNSLIPSTTSLVAGQWTHLVAVYDGSTMEVYQNGTLRGSVAKSGKIPSSSVFASLGNTPSAPPVAKLLRDLKGSASLLGESTLLPLTGSVTAPLSTTSAGDRNLLTDELQLTWNDTPIASTAPLTHPGTLTTYQLFPGGPVYTIPVLGTSLNNQTLEPDPQTNPLGVFSRVGNLDVFDNVSVTGTIIGTGTDTDIEVYGDNVRFDAPVLPAIAGGATNLRLPVAIMQDDFRIYDGASGEVNGLVVTWDECGFKAGSQSTAFTITGRVIANEFYFEPRNEWNQSHSWWKSRLQEFYADLAGPTIDRDFPSWLQANHGLDPQPKLLVRPPQSGETFHWPDWSQPLFVAHPSDGGLRWEVLDIRTVK